MLKVRIFSFSYLQNGIPKDETQNGGGFVFDCRFIANPGKFEEFKNKTGKDIDVKLFLETQTDMTNFMKSICIIAENAIKVYVERDFTDLMISFGCTGGRHRSVYAADAFGKYIAERFPNVTYEINHLNI